MSTSQLTQGIKLIYPTVDLFIYDLHDSLGESQEEIDQNRQRFWEGIYGKNLPLQQLTKLQEIETNSNSSNTELLGNGRVEIFKPPFDGYYYPLKIGDTYALQIDYSGKINDTDWEKLDESQQIQEIAHEVKTRSSQISGEIGKSWLFWGKLAEGNTQIEATAKFCYQTLGITSQPDWNRDLQGQGNFLGVTLFELESLELNQKGKEINSHLIICLFPNNTTDDEIKKIIGEIYKHFIQLFHNRNKILWAYQQSRELKIRLKQTSNTIQKLIQSLSQRLSTSVINLNQLQKDLARALSISYYYQTSLDYLREQLVTIQINNNNYRDRLQKLENLDKNSDLKFLSDFNTLTSKKYLAQIKADNRALSVGFKPLENYIETIKGIIEIEKTKNDRALQKTIAITSVGISSASLTAIIFNTQANGLIESLFPVIQIESDSQIQSPIYYLVRFIITFGLSIVMGLIFGGIRWLYWHQEEETH